MISETRWLQYCITNNFWNLNHVSASSPSKRGPYFRRIKWYRKWSAIHLAKVSTVLGKSIFYLDL